MEHIEAIAVKCLIESGVHSLPVDVTQIAFDGEPPTIDTYARNRDILRSCQLENYAETVPAFSIIVGRKKYVFYDERLSYSDRTLFTAHELGHFALGHTLLGYICGKSQDPHTQDRQEKEADAFAIYLLAPACLLFAAGITGPREIARAAGVADELARHVAGEIARLKDYVPAPDEERLCKQFRRFIILNKYRKPLKYLKYAAAVSVITAMCVVIPIYFVNKNRYVPVKTTEPPQITESRQNEEQAAEPEQLPEPARTAEPEQPVTPTQTAEQEQASEQPPQLTESPEASKSSQILEDKSASTGIVIDSTVSPDTLVYTVGEGTKFHLGTCGVVRNRSDQKEWTIKDAIQAGFGACNRCKPLEN